MKRSTEHILTTHCGSLPRPTALLDLMKSKLSGTVYDAAAYTEVVKQAVTEAVRQQVACGLDVVNDGEQGKPGCTTKTMRVLCTCWRVLGHYHVMVPLARVLGL